MIFLLDGIICIMSCCMFVAVFHHYGDNVDCDGGSLVLSGQPDESVEIALHYRNQRDSHYR